jgi:cell wall-associated NlpC family hydrolase
MAPAIGSGTGGLLTAKDPNALLQGGNYLQYMSDHRLSALGQMDRATVAKSNADAKAKQLLQLQQKLTDEANAAQKIAREAFRQQQVEQVRLQAEQAYNQRHLIIAQNRLAALNNRKHAFDLWQAEQQRIAAEKARRERLAREAALRAAQAAQAAQNGGGGGGGGGAPLPPAGSMGGWTAAKGQAAVNRALAQVGQTYIWAGGSYSGPTDGGCSDPVAACGTTGFDCSGLVLYAWAPQGLYMDHFAATQFSQAGSYHPGSGDFQPGDLLFWGLPSQGDIHHVAMYIGNGMVVQAPYSGTVVQVTPWDQVSGDYYGATRPLS